MVVMPAVTAALLDLPLSWAGAAAGIAFSAVAMGSGPPMAGEAWMFLTGSRYLTKSPQGRYSVDQAQHVFRLEIPALLITLV
ncbi:hypothetical protein ACWY4P_47685 [Streptomyces sp. LZ34]